MSEPTTETPTGRQEGRSRLVRLTDGFGAEELDLKQLLRTFWRRKWLVIGTALLFVVVAGLILTQQTPRYTTSASIMLDTRESKVVDVESVLSGLPADAAALMSEIEVIRSTQLIGRVVDKLRLDRDPEFNASLRDPHWSNGLLALDTYLPDDWLVALGVRKAEGAEVPETDAMRGARARTAVINAVQGRLSVQPVQRSLVIEVRFESEQPRKAALIANTVADQYLVDQLEAKFEATQRATSWLNERLADLKAQVEASEEAVERYKANLSEGVGQSADVTEQQLTQINAELIVARTNRAEAEARFNQIDALLNEQGIGAAADMISSPLIQNLRQQLAELRREEAELSTRYGDRHPKMINIRAEIDDTLGAITREVRKVANNLRTELEVARTRENALEDSLNDLEDRSSDISQSSVQLRQLEREAEANRLIYQNFLSRFKETRSQEEIQQPDARVISQAEVPTTPSSPKKGQTLALAGLGGAFVGVLLVFLLEQLDNAFRSARQIEESLGLSTLGIIPLAKSSKRRKDVLNYVIGKPTSSVAEAVRTLRTALLLTNVDETPRTVVVTSSVPEEGKSTTALLLAETSVKLGKSVLLVDCDLRRPTLHQTLDLDNETSLIELLNQSASLEEVVHVDERTGIHLIPAARSRANPIDLLVSKAFDRLVADFRQRYDMVIFDVPPTLAVSDTMVVGKHGDALIYVVKWNETPREAVQSGVRYLREAGLKISGVVLAQVDVREHARYGYGDSAYYYGRYKDYYQD